MALKIVFAKMAGQVLKDGPALKADDAVLFERPPESGRDNRQGPWLTLIGDFNRYCGWSGSARLRTVRRRVFMS
jgi:hypothetical protein